MGRDNSLNLDMTFDTYTPHFSSDFTLINHNYNLVINNEGMGNDNNNK